MEMSFENYLAIFAAVLAGLIVGWVWYSPSLFGKAWQKAAGLTNAQIGKGMVMSMSTLVVSLIVMAFIMDNLLTWMGSADLETGLLVSFMLWLGFVLPTVATHNKFAMRPKALLWIDAGHQLIVMLIMGAILSVWV